MPVSETERLYRDTLRIEAEALAALADRMPPDFPKVVERVLALPDSGRVAVCGIGKSGHVGRKIASTLASTGTPASFVHATEASHGDLGMITARDVVIAISNSGETRELHDVLEYTRRFSICLVAISSRPDSVLMRKADFRLALAEAREACNIGMAPTTSTTMAMALGDALAVALMARRKFDPGQFRDRHPGGRLGADLATVDQLMHEGDALPVVDMAAPMGDALIEMTSKGFGITGLRDGERLAGVISDGDLRRNMDGLLNRNAADVATRDPVTVPPGTLAGEALAIMNDRKILALFVADGDGRPVGIVHVHDLLRHGVR